MRLKDIFKNEDEYENNPLAFATMKFKAWAEPNKIKYDFGFGTRVRCGFIEPGKEDINAYYQPPMWVEEIMHSIVFPLFLCSQDEDAKGKNRASLLIFGIEPTSPDLGAILEKFEGLVTAAMAGEIDPYNLEE